MSERWRESVDLSGRPAPRVRWISAASGGDEGELGRWRAAVGPVRLGKAPATGGAGWPLTVAVWNAQVGGGAIRALWDHLLAASGNPATPTVLLLQEVFATGPHLPEAAANAAWARRITGSPEVVDRRAAASSAETRCKPEQRTDIVSFAREASLSLVYAPSMRNGGPDGRPPEDRGNAILANVPLSSPRAIELPFERQRRVAVVADVVVGGDRVALCSVHLDNRSPWRSVWRTLGSSRRRQMAGLLDAFPAGLEADSFVLGGDLNTWVRGRREGAYTLARKMFPLPEHPDPRPTHHFEIGGWLCHTDHLMFRLPPGWPCEYRRLDDTFGSDHYPLVGTVEVLSEANANGALRVAR